MKRVVEGVSALRQFPFVSVRRRRAERTLAGENVVSANIPDGRIDEVIAHADDGDVAWR